MYEITIDEIDNILPELAGYLGDDFVSEILDSYSTEGMSIGEYDFLRASNHPLAYWWEELKSGIKNSQERGRFVFSENARRILELLAYLRSIHSLENSNRVIDKLKIRESFYSGLFEAKILSEYKNKGDKISVIEESRTKGDKSPDFKINHNETKIYVECKALEDKLAKENIFHNQMMRFICDCMEKHKRNWCISIRFERDMNHSDIECIKEIVTQSVIHNDLNTVTLDKDHIVIKYSVVAEIDETLELPLKFSNSGSEIQTGMTCWKGEDGRDYCKNPHIVTIHPYSKNLITNRIVTHLKKAKRQLPENEIGILHINLPQSMGKDFAEVVDRAFDDVFRILNKDTTRVNCVVLHAPIIHKGRNPPWIEYHAIIPNLNCKNTIPSDFNIVGTANIVGTEVHDEKDFPYEEGVIKMDLHLDRNLEFSEYEYLANHSTHDGRKQIKVYFSWDGSLTLERFTPLGGRKVLRCESFPVSKNETVVIAAAWSEKKLRLFRNREKVLEKLY